MDFGAKSFCAIDFAFSGTGSRRWGGVVEELHLRNNFFPFVIFEEESDLVSVLELERN